MTALVTVNQGTAPAGSDGDTVRAAFTKVNSNVTVLQTQAALTLGPTITTAQALTAAHVGKRININLSTAGVVNLPSAATCLVDSVILLRNTGTTVVTLAITTGSGDTVALSKLNPGETALMDTDGVHAWSVLMRGRTNSDNETVNGNCTVNGNETVGGTLSVTGAATLSGGLTNRPTFAGNVPWDKGNLPVPVTSSNNVVTLTWVGGSTGLSYKIDATSIGNLIDSTSAQTISGNKTFTGGIGVVGTSFVKSVGSGVYSGATLWLNGDTGVPYLGFSGNNNASAVQLRLNTASGNLELMNYNATAYSSFVAANVTASDARLKEDVETIDNAMVRLRKIRGVRYTMDGERQVGVIAQEVRTVFPELVVELGDVTSGPPSPDNKPLLGVRYTNLVGPILQGLLETDTLVQSLLSRIAVLEAKCQ